MGIGGLITGPATRAILTLSPFKYGIERDSGSTFAFDLAMSEGFERTADVTEQKIQSGSPINDHRYINLGQGEFVGKISNHSIYAPLISDASGLLYKDRYKEALEALDKFFMAQEAVTLFTVMKKHENVLIKSLSYDRDPDTGQAQTFRITFSEVNIISPESGILRASVDIPMTLPDNRQGSKLANLGGL